MLKFIRPLIAIVFSFAVIIAAIFLVRFEPAPLLAVPPFKQTVTLQLLKREQLAFLVTERIVTQVIVEEDRSSVLLGKNEGYLVATARLYYGIDLSDLTANDIIPPTQPTSPSSIYNNRPADNNFPAGTTIITLPRPRFLDAAIDPDDRYVSKRSGLMWLHDNWTGEDNQRRLRMRVQQAAYDFAADHHLIPDDQLLLDRLSPIADMLTLNTGSPVRFAYRATTTPATPSAPSTTSTPTSTSTP